ncbi:MAG TPA: halocarboxylic acid dehydrogenase DehI family protein [Chloroflexota bacterium]|nr:halocarboxylic acid dehydrogenase DehI family protein [Chloroflexota bacterium]
MPGPVAPVVRELADAEATGPIATAYADLKAGLRLPYVGQVFRVLAIYPDFLQLAWRQLAPNVATTYFETASGRILERVRAGTSRLSQAPDVPAAAAPVLRACEYADAKLLLAVAIMRSATRGELPRLQTLPPEMRAPAPAALPGDRLETIEFPEDSDPGAQAVLDQIASATGWPPSDTFRAIARWPDYLGVAWPELESLTADASFRRLQTELRRLAEECILALPYRTNLSPHVLRQSGLSEEEIDNVHDLLDRAYAAIAGAAAATSWLSTGGTRAPSD